MDILSPWLDDTPAGPTRSRLDRDLDVDVCVIGGGITGITTALLLTEAGRSVAVLDMDRIGTGVTGYTTAKVSALQGTVYDELQSGFGTDGARIYAEANSAAIGLVEKIAAEHAPDCAFRRKPNYTYTRDAKQVRTLEKEQSAARQAGLDVQLVTETELPYPVEAAIRLDDQGEFHPRRYLLGIADAIESRGAQIFERTTATAVREDDDGCTVSIEGGRVTCRHVVVATHYPFLDRAMFFARLTPMRSYAIGIYAEEAVHGMYISSDQPTRSIRSHPTPEGELLVIGGEGHKTGEELDTKRRYAALEEWAREHFTVRSIPYHWSAHDNQPADGMPYIGAYTPRTKRLWTGSGFRKWGMSNGTVAAVIISDGILGRENPWAETFSPNRFKPIASAKGLVKENVKTGLHFFGDRLSRGTKEGLEALAPGQGGVVNVDGEKIGAYRREDGVVEAVKPVCTHLGCHLNFNTAEKSWDCPCHGSRFRTTGEVFQGPAVAPLERRDVGAGSVSTPQS